ncbi:SDR family oxidoreductase [Solibacillus sp. R5-41]|uniref:SDR family oxidoreductase n=1 Tax=Solibacillus sp. R5-41 TaxID=2048654 RepID=UPI0012FE64AA|nr:SDR family oxidoreductase [Solibacillus sp. R5-41]
MGIHFLTGFPGFVATELIHQLFKEGITKQVFAVVLPSDLAKAKSKGTLIEGQYEGCQIVLFEGDITLPNLGLADEELAIINPKITFVWHLAAIYDFAVSREVAWKVNVHGTANVNDFVCRLEKLERYMYFSSACIAGKRKGAILEMELIRPIAFHNYYEETKFEAELLVDDLKLELPITIIRPGIIYGHSKTGVTQKFDGIYFLFNAVEYFKGKIVIPQLGSKHTLLQMVSVDYIAEASVRLCMLPEAAGETLHITGSQPYTAAHIYQEIAKIMTGKKTFGILSLGIAKAMLEQPSIRKLVHVTSQTIDYLDYEGKFDTKDFDKLIASSEITCCDLMETLPVLIKFYEENKHLKSYYV